MKMPIDGVDFWALSGEAIDFLVNDVWIAARKRARRARLSEAKGPVQESFLWDALADAGAPYLKRRGEQARLARLLGVSRQAVNQYLISRTSKPDAERVLQILVWLADCRAGRKTG
ncbi:MAG TPA: hypothetical protein VMM36_19055 [Opitutaceae bacterium]|nr:hypothetical protein [Opitutaceae bacterium]